MHSREYQVAAKPTKWNVNFLTYELRQKRSTIQFSFYIVYEVISINFVKQTLADYGIFTGLGLRGIIWHTGWKLYTFHFQLITYH